MSLFDVFLLGVAAILIVVAVLAIRFPRGRAEWPLDARQTAWLLVSGLTAVLLFALLVVATRDIVWPGIVTTASVTAALALAVLAGVALLLPQGLRARP